MKAMKWFLVFLLCFAGMSQGFAAEEKKEDASPVTTTLNVSKGMSERISTDDMTYDGRMKAKKAREEFEAKQKAELEAQKKAADAQAAKEEAQKKLKEQKLAAKEKAKLKKRVFVS